MIKVTQWHPDTCGCVLRYEWDSEVPVEEREHKGVEHVFVCEHHRHEDPHQALLKAHEDNTHKNHALRLFGEDATAHYDHDRVLQVRHKLEDATAAHAELENLFPGKRRDVRGHGE